MKGRGGTHNPDGQLSRRYFHTRLDPATGSQLAALAWARQTPPEQYRRPMRLRPSPRWPPEDGPTRARIDPFGQSRHGVSRCLAPRSAAGYRRRGARRCSRRPERPREASGQPSLQVALGCSTVASREDNRSERAKRAYPLTYCANLSRSLSLGDRGILRD